MTVKELATAVVLFCGALTAGGTILYQIDKRYVNMIHGAELRSKAYHLEDTVIELEGVKALYEARLQLEGTLSEADRNRYNTVLSKIRAASEALSLLERDLRGLQ